MNGPTLEHRDYSFVIGLMTGTFVGAGLALWLAPRAAAELRQRMRETAESVGARASDGYRQASTRVGDAVVELRRRGESVRDNVAGVVERGAHEVARGASEVERYAASVGRT
jgi:gas vesicle protein